MTTRSCQPQIKLTVKERERRAKFVSKMFLFEGEREEDYELDLAHLIS